MSEITQEEAVKVAEWLGKKKITPHCEFNQGVPYWYVTPNNALFAEELLEWLLTPEGQSAIMDRLFSLDKVEDIIFDRYEDKIGCDIDVTSQQPSFNTYAPTRQLALIKAVLEMLKGGE